MPEHAPNAAQRSFPPPMQLFSAPIGLLVLQLAAMWPIWAWYVRRMLDGSDEPWGLAALVTVVWFVWRRRGALGERLSTPLLLAGAALTLLAALGIFWLPPLLRAALGVTGLALALAGMLDRSRPLLPLWTLLLLSMPVIASLQFYLGYPLRCITAWSTEVLLGLTGLAVERSGATLSWAGRSVLVDAPCSGVQMLWVGMFLTALLSYFQRASPSRFVINTAAAVAVVMAANVLRNAALFIKEAGIVTAPQWTHAAVGLAGFLMTALAIAALVRYRSARAEDPRPSRWRRPMTRTPGIVLVILLLSAALVPAIGPTDAAINRERKEKTAWPATFQGRALERLPLSAVERRFAAQFPGDIAHFSDGSRHLIIRAVDRPTRLLHPAADCFRGLGYRVERPRVMMDADGLHWSCFAALKDGRALNVCERIHDGDGASWTDVSSWYWAALLGRTRGPWLAATVASPR